MPHQTGAKLRVLRKARGLTLAQLSQLTGCAISYLSMVENGKVDPSISRLKRIADGLGITVVDLFQAQTGAEVLVRKDGRICGEFTHSKTRMEILVPPLPEAKQMDARLAIIHPDGGSEGDYSHPGEEFGLVLKGTLELTIDGNYYRLEEGDSFYFDSTRTHRFHNPGKSDTLVVWVNYPPSW